MTSVGRISEGWVEESWSPKARAAALLARKRKLSMEGHLAGGGDPRLEQQRRETTLKLAKGLGGLRHGDTFTQKLPEGQIAVTRVGAGRFRTEYHVDGGGEAVDPDLRRGPRKLIGSSNVEREVLERQRSAHAAEEDHTARHASATHALGVGEAHHVTSLQGDSSAITKTAGGKYRVDHGIDGTPHTTHDTPVEAVEHAKTILREHKGARFLKDGAHTDPLSTARATTLLKNGVLVSAHSHVPDTSDRTDKMNPSGAVGDIAPDMVSALMARGAMTGPLGGEHPHVLPEGVTGNMAGSLAHAAASIMTHPATHHVVTHVHQIHHLLAGIEQAEGELQDALDSGDAEAAEVARRAGEDRRTRLAEELERTRVPDHRRSS